MCLSSEMMEQYGEFDNEKIRLRNKSIEIIEILNQDSINLQKLKQIAFSGIPTTIKGLRAVVWRLILNELPAETGKWQEVIDNNFDTYENFKKELIVKPKLQDEEEKKKQMQHMMDHPLSNSTNSVWNTFFKDQGIWDEIEKDVKRTRSDMYFFITALDPSRNISAEDKARLAR